LIAAAYRGRGYGGGLVDHAIKNLRAHGVWLTASELGRPLYERRGFCVIGGVERWAREGKTVDEFYV
jgi:GNAT superfamily N-acetyltransferase